MKELPVVQPTSALPNVESSETSGLVDSPVRAAVLRPQIVKALSQVFDPESPVNIYELGLIYDIVVTDDNVVGIRMTLTAPACPAAQVLPLEVKKRVAQIAEVADVKVDVVWDPPWDRDRMSDAAKLQLGMF